MTGGELRKSLENFGSRAQLYFYRDQQAREVDFVVEAGGKLHLIECKRKEIPDIHDARTMLTLRDELPTVQSCHIIANTRQPSVLKDGVRIWGAKDVSEMLTFIGLAT